ncbi:MAG TPA: hypothetical protein PKA24_15490, partial [Microthrixaceae bacterium]|nr:hypothetical protein [Microthrixaceae bacterium]
MDGLIRGDSVRVTARLDRDVVDVVADVLAAEVDGPKVTFDVLYRRFSAEFSRRHPDRTGPSKAKLREYFNRSPEGRYQLTVNTRTKRTNRRRHRSVFEPRRVYLPGDRVDVEDDVLVLLAALGERADAALAPVAGGYLRVPDVRVEADAPAGVG